MGRRRGRGRRRREGEKGLLVGEVEVKEVIWVLRVVVVVVGVNWCGGGGGGNGSVVLSFSISGCKRGRR